MMARGVTTTEWKALGWVFKTFVAILVFFLGFVCWGYAAGDLQWQEAMDALISVMKFFFAPVGAAVVYIAKRGALKGIDRWKEGGVSAEDIVRSLVNEAKESS